MNCTGQSGTVAYELTVVGTLGPVLRHALGRYATAASSDLHTIMRTAIPADRDLVDLVFLLESSGLEITNVAALT